MDVVPKGIAMEFRDALKELKAVGRFGKPKSMEIARSMVQSRLITANGIRWFTKNRQQLSSELDEIVREVGRSE